MRDEMFDRDYQHGRDALNGALSQLGQAMATAFEVLSDVQFRAPWTVRDKSTTRLA